MTYPRLTDISDNDLIRWADRVAAAHANVATAQQRLYAATDAPKIRTGDWLAEPSDAEADAIDMAKTIYRAARATLLAEMRHPSGTSAL